jgi:hypothetical protein
MEFINKRFKTTIFLIALVSAVSLIVASTPETEKIIFFATGWAMMIVFYWKAMES